MILTDNISLWLCGESENPEFTILKRRSLVLDKTCCFCMDTVCVCVWWRMVAVAVRGTSCCFFYCLTVCVCVFVHVTEQKVMRLTLWSHMSPSDVRSHKWSIAENAHIHLHNTQEINTFTPPRCALLLSLPPRLMRELLLLAEGLLLTPSRSQMIVFAAWGPDPTSPDPVTGTVDLSTGFPPRTGHKEQERDETASARVYIILNKLSCYLLVATVVLVWMKTAVVESTLTQYCT